MKKIGYFLVLLPNLLLAQISGVIVDENKIPLFYANIWCKDGSAGATTDIEGKFTVEKASVKDELVVSMAGYKKITVPAIENDTIQLIRNWRPEEGLVVYPEKSLRHTIGEAGLENFFFSPGNLPWIYVKYFKNNSEIKSVQYLDKAIVYTRSNVADATFKLRLFKANEKGEPGEDLIIDAIVVHVKRGNKKNMIDLLKYNVKIPKEGVFVGIEWILAENNRIRTTTYVKGEEVFSDFKYAPDLISNKVEKTNSFRYISGEWKSNEEFIKTKEESDPKPFIEPAINLILTN